MGQRVRDQRAERLRRAIDGLRAAGEPVAALDLAQKLIESGRRHEAISVDADAQLALAGDLAEPSFWRWRS